VFTPPFKKSIVLVQSTRTIKIDRFSCSGYIHWASGFVGSNMSPGRLLSPHLLIFTID